MLDFFSCGTAFRVVVHDAHRLHESVGGRRADESESSFLECPGHRARGGRLAPRDEAGFIESVGSVGIVRFETPEKRPERSEIVAKRPSETGIFEYGFDFPAVPNDTGVPEQSSDASFVPACDPFVVEIDEGPSEILTLSQDREPREARLKSFETEFLEEALVIVLGKTPFGVVVGLIIGVVSAPSTTPGRCLVARPAAHSMDSVGSTAAKGRATLLEKGPNAFRVIFARHTGANRRSNLVWLSL